MRVNRTLPTTEARCSTRPPCASADANYFTGQLLQFAVLYVLPGLLSASANHCARFDSFTRRSSYRISWRRGLFCSTQCMSWCGWWLPKEAYHCEMSWGKLHTCAVFSPGILHARRTIQRRSCEKNLGVLCSWVAADTRRRATSACMGSYRDTNHIEEKGVLINVCYLLHTVTAI